MTPRPHLYFAVLTGQEENVGDSLLRRPYAERLRSGGSIRVWAGTDADYASGLQLAPEEHDTSYAAWYLAFLRAAVAGRASFALNAGEFTVTRRGTIRFLPVLAAAAIARLRGGTLLWLGAGVKSVQRGFTWPYRLYARMAHAVFWREPTSAARIGVDAPCLPDWAFGIAPSFAADALDRRLLAVSLRGDRPAPGERWVETVGELAKRLGLEIVLVVQVRRDLPLAKELAAAWGARVLPEGSGAHDEWERQLRRIYSESLVIISDRLHALIMAATEGAVPLAWTDGGSVKVERHFGAAGLSDVSRACDESLEGLEGLSAEEIESRSLLVADALADARAQHSVVAISRSRRR